MQKGAIPLGILKRENKENSMEDLTIMQVLSSYVYGLIIIMIAVFFVYCLLFIKFFFDCFKMKLDLYYVSKARREGIDVDALRDLHKSIKVRIHSEIADITCKIVTEYFRKNKPSN